MSISGNGQGVDLNFSAAAGLRTTTSQYKVVGLQGATASVDWTGYLADAAGTLEDTATARFAIGINQSYLSATSSECSVRILGVSKAICAESISAGDWVSAYEGVSTTTRSGQIAVATAYAADTVTTTGTGTVITLTPTMRNVLGRALESGSTNTVISIFVNPHRNATFTIT